MTFVWFVVAVGAVVGLFIFTSKRRGGRDGEARRSAAPQADPVGTAGGRELPEAAVSTAEAPPANPVEAAPRPRSSPELVEAVRANDLAWVKRLLDSGVEANSKNDRQVPALHFAESAEMMELLLGAGADIELRTDRGRTPLLSAAANGEAAALMYLLAMGADPRAAVPDNVYGAAGEWGWTAMHFAACMGNSQPVLEMLLAAGADINARNAAGWTPRRTALESGRQDVAEYLESRGGAA